MKRLGALFLIGFLATGCYGARVSARGTAGRPYSDTGFSFLWGLTETKSAAVECDAGLAYVHTYWPWYWIFLVPITAGLVTPVVKEYSCVEGARAPAAAPPAAGNPGSL